MAAKIQKSQIFSDVAVLGTLGVQNLPEIALSLTVFNKRHFPLPPEFKMTAENWKSLNLSEVLEE